MDASIDEVNEEPKIKPRNAFIAFLLSILAPGLGQIYNGQVLKGIVFFTLLLLLPLIFGLSRMVTSFYGYVILIVFLISLQIIIIYDAVVNARHQKVYVLKKYNTWFYHLIIATSMLAIVGVYDIRSILGIRSIHIPTSGNEPTVVVDDNIIIDTKAYSHKSPDYGDLIVFKHYDGHLYNFRIIGKENDTLSLKNDFLAINNKPCLYHFINKQAATDIPINGANYLEFEETLPNGRVHNIYKLEEFYDTNMTNIEEFVVPSESYFVLGDNRDNSRDSRYIGFVRKQNIIGQLLFTYWGKRINFDFRNK